MRAAIALLRHNGTYTDQIFFFVNTAAACAQREPYASISLCGVLSVQATQLRYGDRENLLFTLRIHTTLRMSLVKVKILPPPSLFDRATGVRNMATDHSLLRRCGGMNIRPRRSLRCRTIHASYGYSVDRHACGETGEPRIFSHCRAAEAFHTEGDLRNVLSTRRRSMRLKSCAFVLKPNHRASHPPETDSDS